MLLKLEERIIAKDIIVNELRKHRGQFILNEYLRLKIFKNPQETNEWMINRQKTFVGNMISKLREELRIHIYFMNLKDSGKGYKIAETCDEFNYLINKFKLKEEHANYTKRNLINDKTSMEYKKRLETFYQRKC
jgi:hypothetical protein